MGQTLWFFIKITIVVVGCIWLFSIDGHLNLTVGAYAIKTSFGFFAVLLIVTFLGIAALLQIINSILSIPQWLRRQSQKSKWEKGYAALTHSLTAAYLGDPLSMRKHAQKAKKLLPAPGSIPTFIEGQSYQLSGQTDKAIQQYTALTETEDPALGQWGLLRIAMSQGQHQKARALTEQLLQLYPTNKDLLSTLYRLLISTQAYDTAYDMKSKLIEQAVFTQDTWKKEAAALLMAMADTKDSDDDKKALYKKALKQKPDFIPATLALAQLCINQRDLKKAQSWLKKSWALAPHPMVAERLFQLAPASPQKAKKYIGWFQKLYHHHDSSAEAAFLLARAYWETGQQDNAQRYALMAWEQQPSHKIRQFLAMIKADFSQQEAIPDPVWICKKSGLIYDQWQPISAPYDHFNAIEWDLPLPSVMSIDPPVNKKIS